MGNVEHRLIGALQDGLGAERQTLESAVSHGPHGGVTKTDDFRRDDPTIAGMQSQPVADGGEAGQAFHLHDQTEQVGNGAADPGDLEAPDP